MRNLNRGFTLIELMIVVAIIGILGSLALVNMQTYSYRAKRSEAHVNLQSIHVLEVTYFENSLTFIPMPPTGNGFGTPGHPTDCNVPNDLGFKLKTCPEVRYQYSATVPANLVYVGEANSLTGSDNTVFPGCSTADVWTVTDTRAVMNTGDGLAGCL